MLGGAIRGSVVWVSVTVVVPTYNRAHLLSQTLDSLRAQTLAPTEIIVVDDGSTDNTAEVVERYPELTYLRQENGGKSSALNLALRHVASEYVWFFDDDDIASPDALERLVNTLEHHPECGYSFGTFVYHDSEGLELGPAVGESWHPPHAASAPFVALLEGCYLSGATVMARTACYRALGGFDPRFRRSQDYHMALSLARHWQGVRVQGGPIFHVRRHSGVRGGPRHEVAASEVWRNHYEHDSVIIRELYGELSLQSYLPNDRSLDAHRRQALLQRLSVLTIHRVYPEVLEEIATLADNPDAGRYSADEHDILQRMVDLTNGLATGDKRFVHALNDLAGSPAIGRLRNELLTILARRVKDGWRSPRPTARLVWRATWLVPGGLRVADLKGRLRS